MLTYAGVAVVKPEIILGPWQTSETSIVHVLGIRNYSTRSNTWYVRGVLGNKCAGQHNLKTLHFKETIV